jgi:endonuclease YncB( thermonuclease family)
MSGLTTRLIREAKRALFVSVALVSLLCVAGLDATAEQTQHQVRVVRVVDGDTVEVRFNYDGSTDRVRLIGIDTPEVVDPRRPVQCFGRESFSPRARALLDGQTVLVETDPTQNTRDAYNRLLAYLWLPDGRNFGEVMISDGYAHEYTYDLPYEYRDEFKAVQDQAMEAQVGLWSPATCNGDATQPADNPGAPRPEHPRLINRRQPNRRRRRLQTASIRPASSVRAIATTALHSPTRHRLRLSCALTRVTPIDWTATEMGSPASRIRHRTTSCRCRGRDL